MKLKLFPRSLASLSLAIAAVPGVAPLAAAAPAPAPRPMPMIPGPAVATWTHLNVETPGVRRATAFAVTVLDQEFGRSFVVERIQKAEAQVAAGVEYRVRIRIAEVHDSVILGARKDCTVVVWSRPWLKPADVVRSFTCQALGHSAAAARD
jgi:hypothetical protein